MTPQEVYEKARAGKRLPELEHIILNNAWHSYLYALNVVKGRWIEAEDFIMNNSYAAYHYALHIMKGKLPEKMHNMMILHAIEDSDTWYIKAYFKYIK